jgi:CO/xanthine dehydrogenase Mo-binding subunit
LEVDTVINPYVDGPFGAKGAGEVPTDGPAPAYLEAMEQALGCPLYHIPFTMEDTLKKLEATL